MLAKVCVKVMGDNPLLRKADCFSVEKFESELNDLMPVDFSSCVNVTLCAKTYVLYIAPLSQTIHYTKNVSFDYVAKSVLKYIRHWAEWHAFRREMRVFKPFFDLAKRLVQEKQGFLYVDNAEIPKPSGGSSVEPCYILRSRTFCAKVSLVRISKNRNATQLFNELVQESLETRRLHRLLEKNGIEY